MNDFIAEIDEQIKEEKLLKLWRRYGNHLIGVVLSVIIATTGYVGWKNYKQSARESESLVFFESMKLLTNQDYAGSINKLEPLAKDSAHYQALAQFRKIALIIEQANQKLPAGTQKVVPQEAITSYKTIMNDKKIDAKFRNLASISYVLASMDQADPKQMLQVLSEQTLTTNPWAPFAKELMIYLALKAGDKTQAKKLYDELSKSQALSEGMAGRLFILKSLIGN